MNVNVLLETLFVGTYSALLSRVVNNPFAFGICKHVLGYVIGIHSWFCRQRKAGNYLTTTWGKLAYESIFEGIAVIALCTVFGQSIPGYFAVGAVLHLAAEYSGTHTEILSMCHM